MNQLSVRRKQVIIAFAISLVITVLAFSFSQLQVGKKEGLKTVNLTSFLENYFYDYFTLIRNLRNPEMLQKLTLKIQDKIVVVIINDETLRKFGRWQEWSREKSALLIEKLAKAKPSVIFIDALFTEPSSNIEVDRNLAAAYAQNEEVILPAKVWKELVTRQKPAIQLPLYFILAHQLPPEKLAPIYQNRCGITSVEEIERGRVRKVPLVYRVGEGKLVNVNLLCWMRFKGFTARDLKIEENRLVINDHKIPLDDEQFLINYIVRPTRRWEGSYADFFPLCDTGGMEKVLSLDDETLREIFSDKIVLVGATSASMGDIKDTPVGSMPGIYINAVILANLLENLYLKKASAGVNFIILLALGFFLTFLIINLRPAWAGGAGILTGSGFVIASYAVFSKLSLFISTAVPLISTFFHLIILVSYFYLIQEQQKNFIKKTFGEYLSPEVVDELIKEHARGTLGMEGKKEVVTIFYSDIRNFTPMAEKMTPTEVVSLLNEYFDRMAQIVIRHGGYIDKYIGDCLMAIFTAPVPTPDDPRKAILSAVQQQEEIMKLKQEWKERGIEAENFYVGMGLNTGEVVLGNIGSPLKKDYTVIGDNVNLAARLYDKAVGGQILISSATYEQVKDVVETRLVGTLKVKGKSKLVRTYEVLGRKGQTNLLNGYPPDYSREEPLSHET